jgi:hypothetical protein
VIALKKAFAAVFMGSIRALKKKAVLYLVVAEVFKIQLHQLSYQL